MDPKACAELIQRCLNEGDWLECREHVTDLSAWLDSGGFAPRLCFSIPEDAPAHVRGDVLRLASLAGEV